MLLKVNGGRKYCIKMIKYICRNMGKSSGKYEKSQNKFIEMSFSAAYFVYCPHTGGEG